MTFKRFCAAALAASALCTPAHAADYVHGYVGLFDFVDQDNEATQFGVEYRMSPIAYGFRPMLGANVTTDGSLYGYGGFAWDVPLIDNQLYLVPNFAAGAYAQGDGKDLGHALEFRSGIELMYQMVNTHRVGVAINHVSNASIGDKNPGAETILFHYGVPTDRLF
jgi:lipid A 3-O-deacylase